MLMITSLIFGLPMAYLQYKEEDLETAISFSLGALILRFLKLDFNLLE